MSIRGMSEPATRRTYDLWSNAYDLVFAPVFYRRMHRAIDQLHLRPGDRVLDLGVGTGLSLDCFPRDVRVVGLDLSAGMLAKAAAKCREQGLDHCSLVCGDALQPPFPDGSFDHILITHVITVVSDPVQLLRVAGRLVRPGGRIVLVNHFRSTHPLVAWFERTLNPLFVRLGWRSDLRLDELLGGCELHVERRFKIGRLDLFQIVVLTTRPGAPSGDENDAPAGAMPDLGRAAPAH